MIIIMLFYRNFLGWDLDLGEHETSASYEMGDGAQVVSISTIGLY